MKRLNWFVILGLSFFGIAFAVYSIHYLIFRDSYFISKYLIAQLGFLPINVYLVTIVINQLMSSREKRARMQKMNMIIGAFFSDIGTELLSYLSLFDRSLDSHRSSLCPQSTWGDRDFNEAAKQITGINFRMDCRASSLQDLRQYLTGKRMQLLSFLENPNLLEHENFSELIWAVFHLQDELLLRTDPDTLSDQDAAHLSNDIKRAYILLIRQWMEHMRHIKRFYPYLYSLAVRTNPFD